MRTDGISPLTSRPCAPRCVVCSARLGGAASPAGLALAARPISDYFAALGRRAATGNPILWLARQQPADILRRQISRGHFAATVIVLHAALPGDQ